MMTQQGLAARLCLLACLLLGGVRSGVAQTPDAPGPYETATFSETLVTGDGTREIPLLFVAPIQTESQLHACPLIIFSHGFLLEGPMYQSYATHLAAHGFIVALPTYPLSLIDPDHRQLADDLLFLLEASLASARLPNHPLYGRIDPHAVGVAGHSLGGKISLLAAYQDDRIRAAGLLDPVDSGNPLYDDPVRYPSVTPEMMPSIHIPLLLVGASLGGVAGPFPACAPIEENYAQYFEYANPPATEITQRDVGHGQYVDDVGAPLMAVCARGEVTDNDVRSAARAYLTAFFLAELYGDENARGWMAQRLSADEAAGRVQVREK